MAGILPSTPEAARAEIERLLANVPGLDLSIHQELLASDGLSQIVHMTNGNWTEVRVHGRLNGGPADQPSSLANLILLITTRQEHPTL